MVSRRATKSASVRKAQLRSPQLPLSGSACGTGADTAARVGQRRAQLLSARLPLGVGAGAAGGRGQRTRPRRRLAANAERTARRL